MIYIITNILTYIIHLFEKITIFVAQLNVKVLQTSRLTYFISG
jgi:hypothetical protein